jgi:hypothetical protein
MGGSGRVKLCWFEQEVAVGSGRGQAVKLIELLKRVARGWLTGSATRKDEATTVEIGANAARRETIGPH